MVPAIIYNEKLFIDINVDKKFNTQKAKKYKKQTKNNMDRAWYKKSG